MSLVRHSARYACICHRAAWSQKTLRQIAIPLQSTSPDVIVTRGKTHSSDSSWTQIDIKKALEDATEERKIKLDINISKIFEIPNEKRETLGVPTFPKEATKVSKVLLRTSNEQSRESNVSYTKVKDLHKRTMLSEAKKDKNGNAKYSMTRNSFVEGNRASNSCDAQNNVPPEFQISEDCKRVRACDFDLEDFVAEGTPEYESSDSNHKESRFSQEFQKLAGEMLNTGAYQVTESWLKVQTTLDKLVQEMRVDSRPLVKHWPSKFMVSYAGRKLRAGHHDVIKSLWDFSQEFYKDQPPALLMAAYMNILTQFDQENEALELYKQIQKATQGLTEISIYQLVIRSLSRTKQWQECRAITESLEKFYGAVPDCWFDVAMAHLLHGDIQEYEKIMEKLISQGYDAADSKHTARVVTRASLDSGFHIMRTFASNMWLPNVDTASAMLRVLTKDSSNDWTVMPTEIKPGGQCSACGRHLEAMKPLTAEQFALLQNKCLPALIDGTDIYLKSNPQERQSFLHFQDKHGPFDIVVDGLNICYAKHARFRNMNLQEVISTLRMKYSDKPNILVVIRQHMMRELKIVRHSDGTNRLFGAHVFPLRNESEDDPYLLLAALRSGQGSMVLSNDDYSDQSYTFGAPLRPLFIAWQRSNQIFYEKNARGIVLQWPSEYQHSLQVHNEGWHIPFSCSHTLAAKVHPPNTWLCCLKQPKSS